MGRNSYPAKMTVNNKIIEEIIIDSHYLDKHSESMNDNIILGLVKKLDGGIFIPDDVDNEFEYFKADPIALDGKKYRLIWLLKKDCSFLGVVNAFRRR
ncbi:MAG: hypothetical protein HQK53_01140 [Oligoflexia bacterium]|nr:hypothetical protein [Oligoflexia bacterium]